MKCRMILSKTNKTFYILTYKNSIIFTFCPMIFDKYFPVFKGRKEVDIELIPCKNITIAKAEYEIYLTSKKLFNTRSVNLYNFSGLSLRYTPLTNSLIDKMFPKIKEVDYYGVVIHYE